MKQFKNLKENKIPNLNSFQLFNLQILFVAFVVAACSAEEAKPERYPAGLDPLLCPGYPNCDNALLHGTEKIQVLPTYQKSIVPGYKYYSYNQLSHIADE